MLHMKHTSIFKRFFLNRFRSQVVDLPPPHYDWVEVTCRNKKVGAKHKNGVFNAPGPSIYKIKLWIPCEGLFTL